MIDDDEFKGYVAIPGLDAWLAVHPLPGPIARGEHKPEDLSYGRWATVRRRELLEQGRHPATLLPLRVQNVGDAPTCGDCALLVVHVHNDRTYFKCGAAKITFGGATDIRKGWPACTAFERLRDD